MTTTLEVFMQDEKYWNALEDLWLALRTLHNPAEAYEAGVELLSHMVDRDINGRRRRRSAGAS